MVILALGQLTYYSQVPDLLVQAEYKELDAFPVATGKFHMIVYLILTWSVWVVAAEIHRNAR